MEQQDVERILRDVVSTLGLHVKIVRVQHLTGGWLVMITDDADRIVNTRIPDGSPAELRAALEQWLNSQS